MSSLRSVALELTSFLKSDSPSTRETYSGQVNKHPEARKAEKFILYFLESKMKWRLKIDSAKYLNRIAMLIIHPYELKQKSFGLCGCVSFLITVIYHNPMAFAKFAFQLLLNGEGYIGDKFISTGKEFKENNYDKIYSELKYDNEFQDTQADLIMMGAIMDDEGGEWDDFTFTGPLSDEDKGINPHNLINWYNQTKLFINAKFVEIDSANVSEQIKLVLKQNKYAILVHQSTGDRKNIISETPESVGHGCFISQQNNVIIVNGSLLMTVLSWGKVIDVDMPLARYSKSVQGYIVIN